MASSNKVFVSPGVYTTERDLSFVTRQVGVTTAGIVGESIKGPAFQPIFVSNYDEYVAFFGGQNPEKFKGNGMPKYEASYIAKSYLSETNQMYMTRILGLSGYKAGQAWAITLDANIDNSTTGVTGGGSYTLEYSATTAGTITSIVSSDPVIQEMYDRGLLDAELAFLGTAETGATSEVGPVFYKVTETGTEFSGVSFNIYVDSTNYTTSFSGSTITGSTTGVTVAYNASSYTDVENKVVALLRSRGQYDGNEQIIYELSASTQVAFDGSVLDAQDDPYGKFVLSGTSNIQGAVSYELSFDKAKKNYISRVLGVSESDGKASLFVEELYQDMLEDYIADGKVRGINLTLVEYNNSFNNYNEEYQPAVTPYIVSEKRGSEVIKLFRFWTISDGNYANKEFKISIRNIRPDDKRFDVIIRSFNDTDANPVILESFSNCTMDPTDNGYIARKIGTLDGDFESRSSYVLLELDDDADTSDAFPAGFLGYPQRDYTSFSNPSVQAPSLGYKQAYASSEKKRKVYLGISDTVGIDQDFFDYKGLDNSEEVWTGATNGFHLDSGATSVNIGSTVYTFDTGNAEFRTEVGVVGTDYEKVNARKFTLAPYGGFDGWDIYRDERTIEDTYTVNGVKGDLNNGVFEARVLSNGENGSTSDYYAYLEGIRTFANPEAVDINVFATPGINVRDNSNLIEEAIDMIEEERADSLYIVTTPDVDASGNVLEIDDVIGILEDGGYDSNYTATYWPWVQVNDTENNQYVWLPPTRDVFKNIALTDNIAYPWFASAGVTRGRVDAVKARKKLTQIEREDLYAARINPIATSTSVGINIWGNKTLQVKESALDRINVRRLLLQARKLISAVSLRLLFEQNDTIVRTEFLSLVNPILDNIRKERGITQFRVQLDENADRNELTGKIFIQPTDALEVVRVEFNITSAGASFDNI